MAHRPLLHLFGQALEFVFTAIFECLHHVFQSLGALASWRLRDAWPELVLAKFLFGFLHLAGGVGCFAALGCILQSFGGLGILGLAFLSEAIELVHQLAGSLGEFVLLLARFFEVAALIGGKSSRRSRRWASPWPVCWSLLAIDVVLAKATGPRP